jgi:hypothetical protein
MSGHVVTGVGPALVMYGYPGVGLCRRGKPLFGCQASGCAEQEVGCGSRATGSKLPLGYVSALDHQARTIWIVDAHRDGKRFADRPY